MVLINRTIRSLCDIKVLTVTVTFHKLAGMSNESSYSIGELAGATGLTRRAIRFYVQRGLLPPPSGRGRGRHYGREHVERLQQVKELQIAGHALEAIKCILDDEAQPPARTNTRRNKTRAARRLTAQLWTRVQLAEGVELQLDTAKHLLDADQLVAIQQAVGKILQGGD